VFDGQPFPGVYPAALGREWRERLETNPSMRELVAGFAQVPLTQRDVTRSVNTREDAAELGVDIP